MNKKCQGCGVTLQSIDINREGYTNNLDFLLCKRCFRIKHYNDYQRVNKGNTEYIDILTKINKTKDLVLYVIDITNFNEDITKIKKYINNPTILILNKKDLLPLSTNENKIISYFKDYKFLDIILISSKNNYNLDKLFNLINKYKVSKYIYVVGNTNAGKSTLINKMIYNYSHNDANITTSPLSSTTLDTIEIVLDDNTILIDTPGLIEKTSLVDLVDKATFKKITMNKELKPKTYRLYPNQSIIIDNILVIDYIKGNKNSFTVFTSNNLKITKIITKIKPSNFKKETIQVYKNEDLVIPGLGWIKIIDDALIDVYLIEGVKIHKRKSLI
ncbi:MAG: 50S ribosome-binding GTPase [Bacilli bacterium]|nr:50S ribosome-binding GTPase [Bacilli bacterium]